MSESRSRDISRFSKNKRENSYDRSPGAQRKVAKLDIDDYNRIKRHGDIREAHESDRPSRRPSENIRSDKSTSNNKNIERNIKHSNPDSSKRQVWGNIPKEEEIADRVRLKEVPEEDKQKANFGLTGALAKDEITGNVYNGVVLKWTEPLDAARPTKRWRLYVFKGEEVVETLYLHRQSAYLAGRESKIADIVLAHPSCSKQHAVIQFRSVEGKDGKKETKPYLLDLESTNKSYVNNVAVEDSRYIELRVKDSIRFGLSTREYILLHDECA